ncbi:hypothetical protein [Streptosporangium sp. NPDC004631]
MDHRDDDYHLRFVHRRLNKVRKQIDAIARFEGRTTSGYKPHSDNYDMSADRTDLSIEDLRGSHAKFVYPVLPPQPYAFQLMENPRSPLYRVVRPASGREWLST